MPRQYRYTTVDVFTDQPFSGNSAAVVLDATGLSDSSMADLAREFNLSETTFVLPAQTPTADLRFRWFTPTVEVSMCGHATLAGVHALTQAGMLPQSDRASPDRVAIETASGLLQVQIEADPSNGQPSMIWLDLCPAELTPFSPDLDELTALLGLDTAAVDADLPLVRTSDDDFLMFLSNAQFLADAQPNFGELARWCRGQGLRGACLSTRRGVQPGIEIQSRFFAPAAGINEDPVTGSVHGPLGAYLVLHGLVRPSEGSVEVTCGQGVPGGRGGRVRVRIATSADGPTRVTIGGPCITVMRGVIVV